MFTATLDLSSDNWYTKLVDLIDKQQTAPIWMSETKVRQEGDTDAITTTKLETS